MRKIAAIIVFFVLLALVVPQASGENISESPVKIKFDNKNASLEILINGTQYFYLKFTKLYVASAPYFMSNMIGGAKEIEDMNIKSIEGRNEEMGNYTKVTMWKSFEIESKIPFGMHKKIEVTLTIDFYIAEREYVKKSILINNSMIRYDTTITTNAKNNYVLLEERLIYGNDTSSSKVFECEDKHHWKMMNTTEQVRKHYFGNDHLGMLGFGDKNITFKYMWDYEEGISTLYSYDGSDFRLFFAFENRNGTIIQDPYITLPIPISGNISSIIEHPEKIISYIMDHALSLAIGLGIAAVVIFSAPLIRRGRL